MLRPHYQPELNQTSVGASAANWLTCGVFCTANQNFTNGTCVNDPTTGVTHLACGNTTLAQIGDAYYREAQARLLTVNTGPLLAGYVHCPGQQTWIGEHAAKFIDAATNTYAYAHNPKLKPSSTKP